MTWRALSLSAFDDVASTTHQFLPGLAGVRQLQLQWQPHGRGVHSFTFELNMSRFCYWLYPAYPTESAYVELTSGRVEAPAPCPRLRG